MNWKTKAKIQNIISLLPPKLSYVAYYWLQRNYGALRYINPIKKIELGIQTWKTIQNQNLDPCGKIFFEIGTGRVPLIPLTFWLMGAQKTYTLDLNPYLKKGLLIKNLHFIQKNKVKMLELFGSQIKNKRFEQILNIDLNRPFDLHSFLKLCSIIYKAPADATNSGLPENSVDFHTSNTVLEHIPPAILKRIFFEGNRITKKDGLFVHFIDYSDHFSHSDKKISPINFLQFNEKDWKKLAGNRYMYMNRLRHDDFLELFGSLGHELIEVFFSKSEKVTKLLDGGKFDLNQRFLPKSKETLSILSSWVVSKQRKL